jgi:hypothetical protein
MSAIATGKYIGFHVCAAILTLSACSTNSGMEGAAQIPPAPYLFADLGAVKKRPEAKELSATLTRYLRGKHRIVKAQYFEIAVRTNWVAISKMTASQLRDNGHIRINDDQYPQPDWHRPGYDLIDLYPKLSQSGAFAVAMHREPMANGRILVGYFILEEREQ